MARESSSALPSWTVLLLFVLSLLTAVAVLRMIEQERQVQVRFTTDKALAISGQMLEAQQALFEYIRDYLRQLAVAGPVQQPSDPECARFLGERLKASHMFINLGVPGPDGSLLCNALPLAEPVNVADRGYFQQSLGQRDFAIGEFQYDRVARITSVNFAYPVISSATDRVEGVVVAVVSLAWWSERLAEFRLPEGAVALIVDAGGRMVAHYPRDEAQLGRDRAHYGLTRNAAPDLAPATEMVTGGDGVIRAFAHELLYRSADDRAVTLSVGIPTSTVEAGASQWLRFVSLLFSALVMVILLLAWQTWWKSPRS